MDLRSQRGSALLLSVVVVLTISVIAVGVIRYASREVAGATAGAKERALVACADAGRQLLLSQFKALGTSPLALPAFDVALDGASGTTRVLGGHFDTADLARVKVDQ